MPKRNPKLILTEDEQEAYEERAAILEFDGGHQRDVADRLAREMVLGRDSPAAFAAGGTHDAGILPEDVTNAHARSLPLVRDALRVFGGVVSRVDRRPDNPASSRGVERRPGQCKCGHDDRWVQVPIHDGRSVRVDCGHCDRFGWFGVWHGRRMPSPFDEVETPTKPQPPPTVSVVQPAVPVSVLVPAG